MVALIVAGRECEFDADKASKVFDIADGHRSAAMASWLSSASRPLLRRKDGQKIEVTVHEPENMPYLTSTSFMSTDGKHQSTQQDVRKRNTKKETRQGHSSQPSRVRYLPTPTLQRYAPIAIGGPKGGLQGTCGCVHVIGHSSWHQSLCSIDA